MRTRKIRRSLRPSFLGSIASAEIVAGVGRDLLFLMVMGLYIVVVGENWGIYAAALMMGAYRNAFRRAGWARRASLPRTRGRSGNAAGGIGTRGWGPTAARRRMPLSPRVPVDRVRKRTEAASVVPGHTASEGTARQDRGS